MLRQDRPENLDRAIECFLEATRIDPNYVPGYTALGEAYRNKFLQDRADPTWIQKAEEECLRAAGLDKDFAAAHVCLGEVYNETRRYEGGLREFQVASDLSPRSAEAQLGQAQTLEKLGRIQEAEAAYQNALEYRPGYWPTHTMLGRFYLNNARYEDALAQYREVVRLTPDNHWGYNNLAAVYLYLSRWNEAVGMARRSIEIQPSYQAYSNLGTASYWQRDYLEAARAYERALDLGDSDYRMWGNAATAYRLLGDPEKARVFYVRAAQLAEERLATDPRDVWVKADLADYLVESGEAERGLALLQEVLGSEPGEGEIMKLAGQIFERAGRREAAIEWIIQALLHGCSQEQLEQSPDLANLIRDENFQDRLEKIKSGLPRNQQ